MSAAFSDGIQLPSGIGKFWIDFQGGFEFSFGFSKVPNVDQGPAQFIVRNVVIRTDREALTIKRNRLVPVGRKLCFVEVVAKGAPAVLILLTLNLLTGGEGLQFFALARDFFVLLAYLFRLALQYLGAARRQILSCRKRQQSISKP